MPKRTKRERRQAALKGWRTRRANARARSLAAKKGWATRRRNARKRTKAKEPRLKGPEYQINVKYKSELQKKAVEIQIAAIGPRYRTRTQILKALDNRLDTDSDPRGWRFHIALWLRGDQEYQGDDEEAWDKLKGFYAKGQRSVQQGESESE